MKFRSAFAVLAMTVVVTACGELPFQSKTAPDETTAPGPSGPPAVSPVDSPIETGAEGTPRATAEASTMNTAMFRAAGAGWTVTAANNRAVYERSGARSTAVTVRRMTYNRGVEFIGTMNGQVFALNIQAGACQAGDASTPFSAKLRVGSQRLSGCASATDTMPKAQVTASAAAPKPKSTAKPKPAAKPAETVAPASAASSPATETSPTPASTTDVSPAPEHSSPVTGTTLAPAATEPASTAPASTTPATAAPASAPADPAPAPAAAENPGVPAPQLVLPPTPPATSL
ncbi:hypothetical protein [Paracoccus ravus]|uniref:hypothetical protein n=1 Tax=Paracoccus ravus TaxID=2447760 RepID=UPI00106DEE48|nr:hypothetical protein [Paracoccus ravus]